MACKIIIAGSRGFNDFVLLAEKMDFFTSRLEAVEVVSGTASGADTLGERWAKERGHGAKQFPAPWNDIEGKPAHEIKINRQGKPYWHRAGFVRNQQMAEYADSLVAFWDGKSKGTAMMIEIMRKMGKPVRVVCYGDKR